MAKAKGTSNPKNKEKVTKGTKMRKENKEAKEKPVNKEPEVTKETQGVTDPVTSEELIEKPIEEKEKYTTEQIEEAKLMACDPDLFMKMHDPLIEGCKACMRDFKETAEICEYFTNKNKAASPKRKSSPQKGVKRSRGNLGIWGHSIGSSADTLDNMLFNAGPEGLSIEQMMECGRKATAVSAHLHHLKKVKGINIEKVPGKKGFWRYVPPVTDNQE